MVVFFERGDVMVIMSNNRLSERLSGVKMTPEQSSYFLLGYVYSLAETLADQELEGRIVDDDERKIIETEYREILANEVRRECPR